MIGLGPIDKVSADTMCAWRNDPVVTKHLASTELSRSAVEAWFKKLGDAKRAYSIEVDAAVVGYVELDIDERNRKCEIGVVVGDTDYWGRGVGTEAVRQATAVAIDELGMHRVLAVASERNPASIRCFLKVGYREEGRLRHGNFRDGEYFDLVLLSILAPEWRRTRENT